MCFWVFVLPILKSKGRGTTFSPTQSSPTFYLAEAEQLHWWYHPMWYKWQGEYQENAKVDWDPGHSGKSPKFAEQWDSVPEKFHQQNRIHISILVLLKNHLYKDNEDLNTSTYIVNQVKMSLMFCITSFPRQLLWFKASPFAIFVNIKSFMLALLNSLTA